MFKYSVCLFFPMVKTLVTGGAGFIGSHIVDALLAKGHEVVIFDNLSSGQTENVHEKAILVTGDITNKEQVADTFALHTFDYIYHVAAQINVRTSVTNPQFDTTVNLIGLLNILESARAQTQPVKKVIFSSSGGAIYGDGVLVPTPESEKEAPISPYGIAKLASEKYLYFYMKQYNIPFVALRYANVYGPRQNPKGEAGVISIFATRMLTDEGVMINGEGRQTRDYVYVKDVVAANICALEVNYGIYNIGTGVQSSVVDIYTYMATILNVKAVPIHGPALQGEQKVSCLDAAAFTKQTQWTPKYTITEGLKETCAWFEKQNNV
ncbi:MAG: UDP-glucose 4-epimerase [Candidatus Woesearchaeota archaeon]|jgi:UDP-glucose 4-epimerase